MWPSFDEDAEEGTGRDAAAAFPTLPRGLHLSLAHKQDGDGAPAWRSLAEAALAPLLVRRAERGPEGASAREGGHGGAVRPLG